VIRVGVIGATGVGAAHVEALRTMDGVEVVAISGSSQDTATSAAVHLGVATALVGEEQMIESGLVDAVHVCTPNDLHVAAVELAVENGIHVICEKPLAAGGGEAARLALLAASAPTASTVCYHYRYSPLIRKLRTLRHEGALGRIHSVRARYLQNWQLGAEDSWRNDPERSGASRVLADIGTHLMDLVELTSGSPIESIDADFLSVRGPLRAGSDDVAEVRARLHGGALVSMSVSQVAPGHMNTIAIEIDGDQGAARWVLSDNESLELIRTVDAQPLQLDGHANPQTASRVWRARVEPDGRLKTLFRSFYGPLLGDPRTTDIPLPTFTDAARHVRLVDLAAEGLLVPAARSEELTTG
jgi:predicted dehydrogenase